MRQRVDQLGVSEPEIQTSGGNEIYGRAARTSGHRPRREAGRHDRAAGLLRLGGQRADAQRQDGRRASSRPRTRRRSRSARATGGGGPATPGAGSMALYDAVKLAAKQPSRAQQRHNAARGPAVLPVRRPRQRRLRDGRGQGRKTDRRRRACTACSPGPDEQLEHRSDLRPALPAGVSAAGRRRCCVVPQGTVVLQAADPSASSQTHSFDRSDAPSSTCSSDHVALLGIGHHQPAAEHRPGRQPRRQVRLQRQGRQRSSRTVTAHDRPARPARQRRSGQTLNQHFAVALDNAAGHGPADRLQAVSRRHHRRQRRRHHRRLHDPVGPGPRHPAAPRRAADQPEADLRVAGLGHAGQAGAAPGPDRRAWRACSSWRCSCSPSTACSA